MNTSITLPAVVPPGVTPLDAQAQATMVERLNDLVTRYLRITATNRLKRRELSGNTVLENLPTLLHWTLTDAGIQLDVRHDADSEQHAAEVAHWLEVAWASAWTQHPYVTEFARPVPPLDVTVTLDPLEVADRHSECTCGLCKWAHPRIVKWGVKRKGLSELYKRIGAGEDVPAKLVLPIIGSDNLRASGRKPPAKSATLTAVEARDWLSLNPRRAL